MWMQLLFQAVGMIKESDLDKVIALDPDKEWSEDEWELYNKVAMAIVEPEALTNNHEQFEKMEEYHDKTETHGFGFVKGAIDPVDHKEKWFKVIDLVEVIGY